MLIDSARPQVRSTLARIDEKIRVSNEKIEKLDQEIHDVVDAQASLVETAQKFQGIQNRLDAAKRERVMFLKQRDDMLSTFEKLDGNASSIAGMRGGGGDIDCDSCV